MDKYDKKAREFYADWRPMTQDSTDKMLAAFGRACAAEAYGDAMKTEGTSSSALRWRERTREKISALRQQEARK